MTGERASQRLYNQQVIAPRTGQNQAQIERLSPEAKTVRRDDVLGLNVMQSQNEQGLLVMRMDTNEGQELSGRQDPCKTVTATGKGTCLGNGGKNAKNLM